MRRRGFTVRCNWKMFLEVFNEYYHLPFVHPTSINDYYPEPQPADDVLGEYSTQFGLTNRNPALLAGDQAHALPDIPSLTSPHLHGTRYTWVFPNFTFSANRDCIWAYHVYPMAPGQCYAEQTVCFPGLSMDSEDFERRAAQYLERFDLAIREDIPALEAQQAGMSSAFARQGRFSTLEPSVGNFACWYAERMSSG